MAKKQITAQFKIQAPGGKATPAPPIGPALGANGVNPGQFIQAFNAATGHLNGKLVGCVITVYADRTFDFEVKSPPAAILLKDAAGVEKLSKSPGRPELLSKIAGLILSPAGNIAGALLGTGGTVAGQVKSHSEREE